MKVLAPLVCVWLLAESVPAVAWEDHGLATLPALARLPEVAKAPAPEVEPFESFVAAERDGLSKLIDEEETWARQAVASYPPRPAELRFAPREDDTGPALRTQLLRVLRLNPTIKLALFLQRVPGRALPTGAGPFSALAFADVSILPAPEEYAESPFVRINAGDRVPALDVLVAACDEPDYGLDIGLWSDNGTEFGQAYGFGKQPFGNPTVVFSSQSPFHMGFYHESELVYAVAGYLKHTYPELRIHQDLALARYAFAHGHPYWGWRLTGWALHYAQDLTQPYHSTALPGVSTARMLELGVLDAVGAHGPKNDRVQLVTNRHFALENFAFFRLRAALAAGPADPVSAALADPAVDGLYDPWSDRTPREVVSARSHAMAKPVDAALVADLPPRVVSDPTYLFGQTDPSINVFELLGGSAGSKPLTAMTELLAGLMRDFGAATRAVVRAAMGK